MTKKDIIVEIEITPDYIMVKLAIPEDENILRKRNTFPDELNLNSNKNEDYIIYPLRIKKSDKGNHNYISIKGNKVQKIYYETHTIDLAFSLTVWKTQGSIFNKIIIYLELSKRLWSF